LINIICVLKSGGDFDGDYVRKLHSAIKNNTSERFVFRCISDEEGLSTPPIDLHHMWGGFWSKIELFRIHWANPTLYFDLDTIIIKKIDRLVRAVSKLKENEFMMLRPFRKTEQWASGIMAWNGDFTYIYKKFRKGFVKNMMATYQWDQRYIAHCLNNRSIKVRPIQSNVTGKICSYKHHCQDGLPDDAAIVCFHGKPRPHEVSDSWMKEYWK